jgi:hypothetical protein
MHAVVRTYSGKGAKELIDVPNIGAAPPAISEGTVILEVK